MDQDLINTWKGGKKQTEAAPAADAIIAGAKMRRRTVLYAHYGTIAVLTVTGVILALFFYFKTPFKETLSHTGVVLMLGALVARIAVEIVSVIKSRSVAFTKDAHEATDAAYSFYRFRKKVHGRVTLVIVALYVAGFYALSPEFSKYIPATWMVMMHLSFIAGALFLTWVIRKGIQKEIRVLHYLSRIRDDMSAGGEGE